MFTVSRLCLCAFCMSNGYYLQDHEYRYEQPDGSSADGEGHDGSARSSRRVRRRVKRTPLRDATLTRHGRIYTFTFTKLRFHNILVISIYREAKTLYPFFRKLCRRSTKDNTNLNLCLTMT